MADIGVIGWGYVGSATGKGFSKNKKNKIFWYDKFKKSPNTLDEVVEKSEFIFICLPTPMYRDYSGMDMSIVESVVEEITSKVKDTDKVLIIKSTVLPGTTAALSEKFKGINFAMNPEFLTQDNAEKDFMNPSRTVIGAMDEKVAKRIKKLYQTILPKDQEYFLTDTTSAELAKYMSNLMLASKVLLANEYYALSKKLGVDYDEIRKIVSGTLKARLNGLKPSDFSFNVKGGRCEECKGEGKQKVEMHFLADVIITCPDCKGKRFKQHILDYRYRGKNIDEILDLTVNEALLFFSDNRKITNMLGLLRDVGLGYIRLGQPAITLSGGEAQRLKIARELGMDADEVLRLCQISGIAEAFKDREFSEAWEIDNEKETAT